MATVRKPLVDLGGYAGELPSTDTTSGNLIVAEQNLGTLTWTGTTAPSGTINQKYTWCNFGNMIFLWIKIDASVAGLLITQVTVNLPSDVPVPVLWSSQPNTDKILVGAGSITTATAATADGSARIAKDGAGTYLIRVTGAATSATRVYASFFWYTT